VRERGHFFAKGTGTGLSLVSCCRATAEVFVGDTWHQTFLFLTVDNKIVTQIAFDEPEMDDANKPVSCRRFGSVNFEDALFAQIKKVQ
jgi:hypothetical protein